MARRTPRRRRTNAELVQAAAFRSALRRFLRSTETVAADAGLTPQRYDLLLMIKSAGTLRVTELCELLSLQQTAVTELVKRSEDAGLLVRKQSNDDGRVWLLQVTPEGDRRLMRAFAALHEDRELLANAFRELNRRFRAATG